MIGKKLNQESADFLYEHDLFSQRYTHVNVDYINEVIELEYWLDANTFTKTIDGEQVQLYTSMFMTLVDHYLHTL